MNRLLFLTLIFCVPLFIKCGNEERILNGAETPLGKFMFLPKMYNSYTFRDEYGGLNKTSLVGTCSTTIISKRHILTAAHCVKYFKNPFNPTISEISLAEPFYINVRPMDEVPINGVDFRKFGIPSNVYVHEKYNEKYENDIAILEFSEGVDFEITPVLLANDYVDDYDDIAIAAGYGNFNYDPFSRKVSPLKPPTLRHVNVKIRPFIDFIGVSDEETYVKNLNSSLKAEFESYKKRLVCAGNGGRLPQRVDEGDSGGPLLFEWKGQTFQLGVASFINTQNVEAPGCYTRVSNYCDWIEKNTDGEANCTATNKPANKKNKSAATCTLKTVGYFWIIYFIVSMIL